jgi:hypothetical protein
VRSTLTPGRLYALLSWEYKKARPARCTSCRSPFPCLVKRPDDASANWYVDAFPECRYGCHAVIAEIIARLWGKYDLVDLVSEAREFPDARIRQGRDPIWNCLRGERATKKA